MAFARSLHTFNRSKKMNCKLSCKAVYTSIASKALEMDQYTVQRAVPSRTNQNNQNSKQTNKKHQNTTKPKQNKKHKEVGSLPMTSCVIMSMATENEQNKDNTEKHKGAKQEGDRSNKSSMRKPEIPPARIPEITESSHSGITSTQALRSKQRRRRVATSGVKN